MFVSLRSAFVAVTLIASTALGNPLPGDKPEYAKTACTSTLTVAPHFTSGPTRTVWTKTTTKTNTVDCGTCKAVTTQVRNLGVGPVVKYTTTVTAKGPATTSAYVCKK